MKLYKITVICEGMQYPVIGELEIEGETKAEAIQWVQDHISLTAKKI